MNEDVGGAATTGSASTTSEWSTILLPIKVRNILEVWRYVANGNQLNDVTEGNHCNMWERTTDVRLCFKIMLNVKISELAGGNFF